MNNADYLERVAAEMIRRPRYCDERILVMIFNEIFRLRRTFRRGAIMNPYNYRELCEEVKKTNYSKAAVDALGRWFDNFGCMYWNGFYYKAEKDIGYNLYPVYEGSEEELNTVIIGYELG